MARSSLNLVTFNVGSLVRGGRRIELNMLLEQFNIDIAFLQETHLSADGSVYLDSYSVLRDSSSLGVGIAFARPMSYSRVNISGLEFPNLFVEIKVSLGGSIKKILCGSIYFRSNCNRQIIGGGLSLILDFSSRYDGLILGGDLNAKHSSWGDTVNNFNGEVLETWLHNESISVTRICDVFPTYPGGSSHLDHFIVSNNILDFSHPNYRTFTLPTFSDHIPLGLRIKLSSFNFIINAPNLFVSYKDINWKDFQSDIINTLLEHFPPKNINLTNEDIDNFLAKFNDSVNFVTRMHSERIVRTRQKFVASDKLQRMLKIKYTWQRDLKSIFTRTLNRKHPEYLLISKQIELIKILIKEQIEQEQATFFNNRLKKIKPGPWAYRQIFRIIGNKNYNCVKEVSVNGVKINESDKKLSVFMDHFAEVFRGSSPNRDLLEITETINDTIIQVSNPLRFNNDNTSLNNFGNVELTNLNYVSEVCKVINSKKSCGLDNVSNYIIKKLPIKALEYVTILFNNCLNNCYFPREWKVAKIIPIAKQKNVCDINNFRPISLLSNIGKLFERIIREKMDEGIIGSYIPQEQFGFKKGNSTVHALLKFHCDVMRNLRERKCTVAVSLDVEKAFDKAFHDGILYKMVRIGFKPSIIKLFQSFFSGRRFCVQIAGQVSGQGEVSCGVPQGSVLAPHLYNIFMHDFPHACNNSKGILFADDSLLYAHDESPLVALQRVSSHLQNTNEFYSSWGIKINAAKSNAICLRNASGKCKYTVVPESKSLRLTLDGNEIHFKDSIKYLGVNFNKLLKFNNHVKYNLAKANRVKGAFGRLFNSKFVPEKTKLLLYKVSIRPILLYAFPIWFSISKTAMKGMEIFERHIVRKCIAKNYKSLNRRYSNSFVYEKAKLSPISFYALDSMRNFVEKLHFFEGSVVKDVLSHEQEFSWSNTQYISSIGILREPHNSYPGRNFYLDITPGVHRG